MVTFNYDMHSGIILQCNVNLFRVGNFCPAKFSAIYYFHLQYSCSPLGVEIHLLGFRYLCLCEGEEVHTLHYNQLAKLSIHHNVMLSWLTITIIGKVLWWTLISQLLIDNTIDGDRYQGSFICPSCLSLCFVSYIVTMVNYE